MTPSRYFREARRALCWDELVALLVGAPRSGLKPVTEGSRAENEDIPITTHVN